MSRFPTVIDSVSHQKFVDIFTKRHFLGTDPFELNAVVGNARDFYTTRREHVSRAAHLFSALLGIMETSEKLRKEGKIGTYAKYLLVARSIELAFLGRNNLVF